MTVQPIWQAPPRMIRHLFSPATPSRHRSRQETGSTARPKAVSRSRSAMTAPIDRRPPRPARTILAANAQTGCSQFGLGARGESWLRSMETRDGRDQPSRGPSRQEARTRSDPMATMACRRDGRSARGTKGRPASDRGEQMIATDRTGARAERQAPAARDQRCDVPWEDGALW